MNSYKFPRDFIWGSATSAYQIEGVSSADDRLPSVWDTFCATKDKVLNGDTGNIACDHNHRYEEDIKLMAKLGIKNYRFSLSWSRIIPEGRGAISPKGIDFYDRLVDCLLQYGITPYVTLYHWDTPQKLEDLYGSWQSREIAPDFADYATVVVKNLGDRVTNWMTINEITCFTHMSYGVKSPPIHPPAKIVATPKEIWQTSHHALLAHGLATQAIRANSPQPCSVSLVDNFLVTVPISETPENIQACQKALHLQGTNGGIIYPALTGKYSELLLRHLGANAPEIKEGDLDIISQPLDSFGFNVYSGVYVEAAENEVGYRVLPFPDNYPQMHMPWLKITPDCIYWGIRHISDTFNRPQLPIFITENGCAANDRLVNGEVIDSDRIFFLKQYLQSAHRAISEGYPLKGYFLWSFLDNFEWAFGYDRRFGIVYVDYESQQRIPKASANWYSQCIQNNRIM